MCNAVVVCCRYMTMACHISRNWHSIFKVQLRTIMVHVVSGGMLGAGCACSLRQSGLQHRALA